MSMLEGSGVAWPYVPHSKCARDVLGELLHEFQLPRGMYKLRESKAACRAGRWAADVLFKPEGAVRGRKVLSIVRLT